MALIKPIEVIKSRLSEVPIRHGQILFCTDTNDIYMDNCEGTRVQMSDIIKLATEEERESMFVPLIGKIYLVEESNKLYNYNGLDWETISIDISINDQSVDYTELEPGILEKKGKKYAPKTLASVVYLENGETVSERLEKIGDTELSYTKNHTITDIETARIEIGISGFDKDNDLLLVYKNSVYIEENIEYIISQDSLYIEKVNGTWNKSGTSCFNFIVLKKIKHNSISSLSNEIIDGTITEQKLSRELQTKINNYESEIESLKNQINELQVMLTKVLM